MMKILIVTFFDGNCNYGALFQATALTLYLRNLGHDVWIFDCDEWHTINVSNNIFAGKKAALMDQWRDNFFKRNNNKEEVFDLAIIGSDQVWGGKEDFFFGVGINAKKIVAYAPAVGNLITSNSFFKSKAKRIIGSYRFYQRKKDLQKFDALSVRDKATQDLVKLTLGYRPVMVMDPTFLIKWDEYTAPLPIKEDYILLYSYGFDAVSEQVISSFARGGGYKIVALNYESKIADYNLPYSPSEALALFKFADYIITDTFHGTVFSLIFNKRFIVVNANTQSKAYSLLNKYGLESNCKRNIKLNNIDFPTINYDLVNSMLSEDIIVSKKFLEQCLG